MENEILENEPMQSYNSVENETLENENLEASENEILENEALDTEPEPLEQEAIESVENGTESLEVVDIDYSINPLEFEHMQIMENENRSDLSGIESENNALALSDTKKQKINDLKAIFEGKRYIQIGALEFDYNKSSVDFYRTLKDSVSKEVILKDNSITTLNKTQAKELSDLASAIQSKEAILMRLIKDKINAMDTQDFSDITDLRLESIDETITSFTLAKYNDLEAFLRQHFYKAVFEYSNEGYKVKNANGEVVETFTYDEPLKD